MDLFMSALSPSAVWTVWTLTLQWLDEDKAIGTLPPMGGVELITLHTYIIQTALD